jgi:hypothetical protein
MSKKVKIYLIIFILTVVLTFLLSSCGDAMDFLLGGWAESCCGSFAFIGAPLLMLKVINKKMY